MKMDNKHTIDKQVRAALEAFEQPYNADHWAAMSAKLDALDADEADFDKSLRARLSDIQPSFAPLNWDKMSAELDDIERTETAIDDSLKSKFERITADYRPNHWQMMSERLDYEFSWRAKIVRYKIVELALMLLALFTVGNYLDRLDTEGVGSIKNYELKMGNPDVLNVSPKAENQPIMPMETKSFYNQKGRTGKGILPKGVTKQPILPTGKPIAAMENAKQNVGNEFQNKMLGDNLNGNLTSDLTNTSTAKVDFDFTKNDAQNAVINPNLSNAQKASLTENAVKNGQNTEGPVSPNSDVKTVAQVSPQAENNSATEAIAQQSNNSIASNLIVEPTPILQANALEINALNDAPTLPKMLIEKKSKWRIGVSLASATDWISTSFLRNRSLEKQTQIAPNAGATVGISYRRGKWEAESGINFHIKKYELPNIEVITGNFLRSGYAVESPKNLRLSIVSIPLSISYHVKETRRWDMTAHIGFTANGIVDAYEIRDVKVTAPSAIKNISSVELPQYSQGILNGGSWNDNSYITASIGVGVEYKLSKRTSVFIQTSAERHISDRGVGTLNDRINSVNIQGGAKWHL